MSEEITQEILPTRRRRGRRRRLAAVIAVLVAAGGVAGLVVGIADDPSRPVLVPRDRGPNATDPLAYSDAEASALEEAAALGLAHPLYAKSPGGVVPAAERTARFRPLVEAAVSGSSFDAALVEAIVFLESGGRPDVIAGDDPARASGLTQILAGTATSFLGMQVDLERSRALTAGILSAARRGDDDEVRRLQEERRAVDARFDPARALAGTVRYLETARERLGRDDLAVVSYHMGIGNLTGVLRAYARAPAELPAPEIVERDGLSWVRVFFDTDPLRSPEAHRLLSQLGDDSPTYYWRVLAAREIMRLYRDDPDRLSELEGLHRAKASAEEALHPSDATRRLASASDLNDAWGDRTLQPLPDDPGRLWLAIDPAMGELAPRLGRRPALYRGLRPEALAMLLYIAERVHVLGGARAPLEVTSTVRDDGYQRLLRLENVEATPGYSLHTTGYAFDIRRRYATRAQAVAFQHVLDTLQARNLIAWVREPGAIHVTVAPAAETLVPAMLEPAK